MYMNLMRHVVYILINIIVLLLLGWALFAAATWAFDTGRAYTLDEDGSTAQIVQPLDYKLRNEM